MNILDVDIDDLIDGEDDIDLSDRNEAENEIEKRIESLASGLVSDSMIQQLRLRLYLITRLLSLGVNRRDLIDDYSILYPPPKAIGNNKCLLRYETVRDGLIDLAYDLKRAER